LADGFERIRESVAGVLAGLSPAELGYQVDAAANPVSWLVWHLTRVQDDHVAAAFDVPQVWSADGWAARFGLPAESMETGFGHSAARVTLISTAFDSAELLTEYHEATYAQSVRLVSAITDDDLERVVDTRWTPAVTLGVRLISVLDDDMQHVGQAAFVRGLLLRARS
jgi:hypothetical protein